MLRADPLRGVGDRCPSAVILSPRTAIAWATGAAAFMVTILPLRRTRSAGWAKAAAENASQAASGDERMETG